MFVCVCVFAFLSVVFRVVFWLEWVRSTAEGATVGPAVGSARGTTVVVTAVGGCGFRQQGWVQQQAFLFVCRPVLSLSACLVQWRLLSLRFVVLPCDVPCGW